MKTKWISLAPAFDYEIYPKLLHTNKLFEEQKECLKEGEEIASYEMLQYCRNQKLHECFIDFWARVFPNPDKISEANGYVAGFGADSDGAYLGCGWYPTGRDSSLGVFVVRKISKNPKKDEAIDEENKRYFYDSMSLSMKHQKRLREIEEEFG